MPRRERRSADSAGSVARSIDFLYARVFHDHSKASTQPYLLLLDRIHQWLLPRSYVEVGVSTGRSLALALPGTSCVGIDPQPKIQFRLLPTAKICAMTSDEFFEKVDLTQALGGQPLDLAFIDGMHRFEFALRDFMNLERAGEPATAVLVHDCLPPDEASASRKRTPPHWTGDVWKLIVCLRERRPDLEVSVADVGPTGLGMITGLDPQSTTLHDHYDEILEHYLAMPFSRFELADKAETLGLVGGDWDTVRPLLPHRPFRSDNVTLLKARRLLRATPPVARQWAHVRARQMRPVHSS